VIDIVKKIIKYIGVFLLILIFNLLCSPVNLDEVWNYGFSNNIYNGLVPYRDFNMVITPFYPFFMSIPFHLFGSSMLVFHITNALYLTIIFMFLSKLLGDKKWIVLLFMFFPHNSSFPTYNTFLFSLLVILIYFEREYSLNINNRYNYLIGFLLGLCFLTKQTVGFCLLLPSIYYIKDFTIIKRRVIGFIIPIIIFIIYILVNNAYIQFIDLCFLGLFDFYGNNKGINILLIISIIMIVITILLIKKDKKNINNYYVLAFYSIIIPIVDLYHFLAAFLAFLLILLPFIKKKYFHYSFLSIFSIILLGFSNIYFNTNFKKVVYPNDLEHFEYRLVNKENYNFTKDVNKFIKYNRDKKIIFLSANSYYFRIINDMPCDYLDLINKGNWGYNGIDKVLEEIKNNKDALFFIDRNELALDSQIYNEALEYVIKEGLLVEKIGVYEIYKFLY